MKVHSKYLNESIDLPTTLGKEGKVLYTHEGFEDCILNQMPSDFGVTYDIEIPHAERGYVVARCVIEDSSHRKVVAVGDADSADVASIRAFDRAAMAYLGVSFPEKGSDETEPAAVKPAPAPKPAARPAEEKKEQPAPAAPSQKSNAGGFSLDTVCTSGKYKADGKTYRQIAMEHPDYVDWCASKGFAPWVQVAEAIQND